MNIDFNPANWNWTQGKVAIRQGVTFISGGVAFAVATHFISADQGTSITGDINNIVTGLEQVAKGVAGLIATGTLIYNTLRATTNASPKEQIKSVAANLSASPTTQAANAVVDPASRNEIIKAVSTMPEVKGIIADHAVATAIPSQKVVPTVADLPPAAKAA